MTPEQALGIDYTEVQVEGELGDMPAWQIAGEGDTWLIFVHGIDGEREGGLRPLPTIVDAGLPTLLITYRNDQGAPASPDGLSHLGQTEWRDLEAAVEYAVGEGAEDIILYGDSMGGAISTRFIHESKHADLVSAMVLDAPALDWSGIIQNQAHQLHLGALNGLVQWMISLRTGVNFAELDELDQTAAFTMPILLFQGESDQLVPPHESKRFADAVGAEFVEVPDAGHIQSWNVDPDAYDEHLSDFLADVLGG
jgi:pimeloyl-ACP methyl ester carboxylesterase